MWHRWKQGLWQWRGAVITAPAVAVAVIGLRALGFLQAWELSAFDQFLRWRPPAPIDERVVIVGISEADLRQAQQWPISDQQLADLLTAITAHQPSAIGLNLYRDLPVEPGHAALTKIYQRTPNLIGVQQVDPLNHAEAVDPPPALAALNQVASNNVLIDADGRLRRGLLSVEHGDQLLPSLALALALAHLQDTGPYPEPNPANPRLFRWGQARFHPLTAREGGYRGISIWGYQFVLNYRGATNRFLTVSMTDVVEGRIASDLLRDRVVLIGSTATSLNDFFYTPYTHSRLNNPQQIPGVEVQAHMVSHLLSAVLDGRPTFTVWSDLGELIWIGAWAGLGATLMWWRRYNGQGRIWSLRKGAAFGLASSGLVGGSYLAFLQGLWIPVVPALVALTGAAGAIVVYMAYMAGRIKNAFGRYLSAPVVAYLLEDPELRNLGGESRQITLLCSDIRGFTQLAEDLPPQDVVTILNIYLGHMTEVMGQFGGTIDELLGDGILCLFGTPAPYPDAADRAVACALAMQQKMTVINRHLQQRGYPALETGIGINTGVVVVGNIGSEERTKYSVVGREVNRVFRIEACTVGGQVLVSDSTLAAVQSTLQIDHSISPFLKGILEATPLHSVSAISGVYTLALPTLTETWHPLPEPCPVIGHRLHDKRLSNEVLVGQAVALSQRSIELHLVGPQGDDLEPLTNLKLHLPPSIALPQSVDCYGKILAVTAATAATHTVPATHTVSATHAVVRVHLTPLPPALSDLYLRLGQHPPAPASAANPALGEVLPQDR